MSGIAAWTVSILCMVGILIFLIELLLRRWVVEDRNRLADGVVSANRHSEAGKGSWTLSPEAAKSLNPRFSLTHWSEMQVWTKKRNKTSLSASCEKGRRTVLSLNGRDFAGKEFSIVDGNRTTVDQPKHFRQEVLCFGGSTTFCMEVSDADTWASCLQRKLNQLSGDHYRVVNFGIAGAPGLDRIAAFRCCSSLKGGDIAVFLFGDNDAGWVQRYPSRAIHHLVVRPLRLLERESVQKMQSLAWLRREAAVILRKTLAAKTAKATIAAAEEVMRWANSRGASVLFVLQPNIMTLARKNDLARQIHDATARNLFVMLAVAYRYYYHWMKSNPNVVSATHLFDSAEPPPYMGDWSHVNSDGNEMIANFIFKDLVRRNLLKSELGLAEVDHK